MITTGGTIASQEGEDGLEPKTTGQQMLDLIPELQDLCEIDCVDPVSYTHLTRLPNTEWQSLWQDRVVSVLFIKICQLNSRQKKWIW